jgi:uncharacterized protein
VIEPLDGVVVFVAAVLAGAIAYVSGFGIGSLLTPLFALRVDVQLAVACVSIPHFVATLWRLLMLRQQVNKEVFWHFGVMSALGALFGALLQNVLNSPLLVNIFACLLIFVGGAGVTGLSSKLRFGPKVAWIAGLSSGMFGGLVGNQGGIRSAALLGFNLSKDQFIATASAIGIIVDSARMPVYFVSRYNDLLAASGYIAVAVCGVIAGTLLSRTLFANVPELLFKRIVAGLILLLGLAILFKYTR